MKSLFLAVFVLVLTPLALMAQEPNTLTVSGKAGSHLRDTVSPFAFIGSAAGAGIDQWRNEPDEWKVGVNGYLRRYASAHAYVATQHVVSFGLDAAFHTDPRYVPAEETRFSKRLLHAVRGTIITRSDQGTDSVNWAGIGGNIAAGQIANVWHPHGRNSFNDGLRRGAIGISYGALSNVVREFWPDVRRRFGR